jgi:hypothetical protein
MSGRTGMTEKKPVGIVLHEKADRLYVICEDGSAYSAKVGQPGIVMGWHEIDPIPGTSASREHHESEVD